MSITRNAVDRDATSPNNTAWSVITARSDRQSPPSASTTARSRTTWPGSWPPPRWRSGRNRADSARVSPVFSATPTSNALPACDTKPSPSDVTSTVKRRPSRITFKVTLPSSHLGPRHTEECRLRRTVQRPRSSGPQLLHEQSGLVLDGAAQALGELVGRLARAGVERAGEGDRRFRAPVEAAALGHDER